jgi:hypothetical protein
MVAQDRNRCVTSDSSQDAAWARSAKSTSGPARLLAAQRRSPSSGQRQAARRKGHQMQARIAALSFAVAGANRGRPQAHQIA